MGNFELQKPHHFEAVLNEKLHEANNELNSFHGSVRVE